MVEKNTGESDNAHYCPELSKKILKAMYALPMWTCVRCNKFGIKESPSSAGVESFFNVVKNCILKETKGKIRCDQFLELMVTYLNGRLKILNATSENENSVEGIQKIPEQRKTLLEEEDWRGLNSRGRKKKESKFVNPSQKTLDSLKYDRILGIPLLKNGNCRALEVSIFMIGK